MNPSKILGILTAVTAAAIISGCSKQEQPAPSSAPATSVKEAPAPAATPAAAPAAAPAAVADTATAAASQAQGLIDKAKALVNNNQYTDASKIIQELSSLKLTPEQQKIVDDLKALVQKKLAEQGTSALGGLLNK